MDLIVALSMKDTEHNGLNCDTKHEGHSAPSIRTLSIKDTQHNDTQHNEIQQNNTKHDR
jgi:hypothetical protein